MLESVAGRRGDGFTAVSCRPGAWARYCGLTLLAPRGQACTALSGAIRFEECDVQMTEADGGRDVVA